jgi:hypothetical protein
MSKYDNSIKESRSEQQEKKENSERMLCLLSEAVEEGNWPLLTLS